MTFLFPSPFTSALNPRPSRPPAPTPKRRAAAIATLALGLAAPLLAVPATGAAQPASAPLRAQLNQLVTEAWQHNLGAARQQLAVTRAQAAVREANGRRLPALALNARYSEYTGVLDVGEFINPAYRALNQLIGAPQFPTNVRATLPFRQETRLEGSLPLLAPELHAGRAAASAALALTGAERDGALRQLAHDIQQAWLGYVSAAQLVRVLEAMRPVLDEQRRVSERLLDAGTLTPDAVLRARADRSELEQQLAEVAGQRDAARRAVNLLRQAPDDAPLPLPDSLDLAVGLPAPEALGVEALLAHALAHRAELAQADGGMALARAQRRLADAGTRPTLALAGSYGIQGEQYRWDPSRNVGLVSLVLSWPVLNGAQDAPRRAQARALEGEAALRRREAEAAIRVQVRDALDAVQVARVALHTADQRAAEAARAFTLVQRRFAEGMAPPVEFLSARSTHTAAALNAVVARYTLASRQVALERAAALRPLPN
jgi:outer membrane protein TolC